VSQPSSTPTQTRTPSPSPTVTPSVEPLGTRRISLSAQSSIQLLPTLGGFTGMSGSLTLAAGAPDPVTGLAPVDIIDASSFIRVSIQGFFFCLKPLVPVFNAGVIACNGGYDFSILSSQDHNIGVVGMNGFTANQCVAAGGFEEFPGDPHPHVCNGPLVIESSPGMDSGVGALLIAPDDRFGTQGLPAEVAIDFDDCEEQPRGDMTVLGFTSGLARSDILDVDNMSGQLFRHDEVGQNFSCNAWTQDNGPGTLVFSIPAVHGSTGGDLIITLTLDD
jgi:hypothetical protein